MNSSLEEQPMKPRESVEPLRADCVGAILVQKFAPDQVSAEAWFEYELVVTNAAERTVEAIVLVESLLSMFRIEDCLPASQGDDPHMGRWVLGPLPPQGTIRVRLRCSARKALRFRSHTSLSYSLES